MRLTRRRFLGGAAAAAVGGAGIYELVDQLDACADAARSPAPTAAASSTSSTSRSSQSEGVEVLVPPLHSEIVTATLEVDDLRAAQHDLEAALADLDARVRARPGRARRHDRLGAAVLRAARRGAGEDASAVRPARRQVRAAARARRFPSDPARRRSSRATTSPCCCAATAASTSTPRARRSSTTSTSSASTSIRRGFAGGGFDGKQSLPKKMAMAAGVPGADLIPDTSELFLGFTSTQKAGLGPRLIANHETLGYVDLRGGYFHGGTHMHLSHISEDLEAWYLNFDFDERVLTAFRPGLTNVKQGAQTVPQGPKDVSTRRRARRASYEQTGRFGHSASIQPTSRLLAGRRRPGRHASTRRARRFRSAPTSTRSTTRSRSRREPDARQAGATTPAAGVHFVVFNPSGDDFERNRLAMDGVLPDGTKLDVGAARARAGLQLGADDDAPPELPRAAAAAPVVPARRACDRRRLVDPRGAGAAARARGRPRRRRARHRVRRRRGRARGDGALGRDGRADPERAAIARERLAGFANVEAARGRLRTSCCAAAARSGSCSPTAAPTTGRRSSRCSSRAGCIVKDDLTPGRAIDGDPVREFLLRDPRARRGRDPDDADIGGDRRRQARRDEERTPRA